MSTPSRLPFSDILSFLSLLHSFQAVERVAMTPPNKERWENDSEHTYQLTMLAWYVATANNLDLDMNKVIRYALVHDLPEVYAGDTYFEDTSARGTKAAREAAARHELHTTLPRFPELHCLLEAYEQQEDEESRFVYAMDKLLDPLNNAMNDWVPCGARGVTLEKQARNKRPKVATFPLVAEYYEEYVAYVQRQQFDGA